MLLIDEVGQEILDYLRSHPESDTTVKFLAETLDLTLSQARARVQKFEYRGLVKRYPRRLPDRCGVERLNYVYKLTL
ncbi:MAG: hypothetical protein RLZZ171_2118 [Cyanobacteriota bacterium]|jgi:DNA-binding MarR family transcriptional regulator